METLPRHASFAELSNWWERNKAVLINSGEQPLLAFINGLKARGEPFYACEICDEILEQLGDNITRDLALKLIEEKALFLAQTGSLDTAERMLEEVRDRHGPSEELLCRLGRVSKDRWRRKGADSRAHLERAYRYYYQAYELFGGYYPAINAAALALHLGRTSEAAQLASAAEAKCLADAGKDYWTLATRAEARLILGDIDAARELYSKAVAAAHGDYTRTATTLAQAREIAATAGVSFQLLRHIFPVPCMAICTGHRIDEPGRHAPRFPKEQEPAVANAIRQWMDQNDVRIGYCSAANGTDILFAEALLARGGECHVVLPFSVQSFREVSVIGSGNAEWGPRFDRVTSLAASVTIATNQSYAPEVLGFSAFEFADEIILGLACIKAEMISGTIRGLAVWDGGHKKEGRAGIVDTWCKRGVGSLVLNPVTMKTAETPAAMAESVPARRGSGTRSEGDKSQQEICAILFADAVGYSKMQETDIPGYLEHFRDPLLHAVLQSEFDVLDVNTWGDAFFVVLRSVREAGMLALRFQAEIARVGWQPRSGQRLLLRTSLHAGPLFCAGNPVTGRKTFTGTHASFGARIEPITPEGQIYASEIFAALCAAENYREFRLEYVGRKHLAKSYGSSRLFQVFPREPES